jgi:tricorn protease
MIQRFILSVYYFLFLFATLSAQGRIEQMDRLFRFPAIHGDQIVFSYAGDLYTVPIEGGTARRLTTHDGYEIFPRFSPDGKTIAFTGHYDGNTEVYSIPATGGIPKRLTYTATLDRDDIADRMGPNNIVMDWDPEGKFVVYRSRKQSFNSFKGSLFKVSSEGGLSEQLPLSYAGFCSYSPDGNQLAFNQVFREFRTWKHYRGGMADDIRIFDFKTKEIIRITDHPSQDIIPMWVGNEIYFLSDRDWTMNLFAYNLQTRTVEKITDFDTYDIKFPSADAENIVFENAGFIYVLNTQTKAYKKVDIQINNDLLHARSDYKDFSKWMRSAWLSPEGKRLAVSARGEVFSVPVEEGITYNLTQNPGAHDRDAVWSPDGKYIAFLSDATGEYEIYLYENETGTTRQLTKNAETYKYDLKWSPDSKKILWNDRKLKLQYVDVESGKIVLVKYGNFMPIQNFEWSPDSRWIVFDDINDNYFSTLYIFNTEDKALQQVSTKWFDSYDAVFSDDGKYLGFVSNRDFEPIYSRTEWNHAYGAMGKVYLMTLKTNMPSPFSPVNDQVKIEKKGEGEKEKNGKNDSLVEIDFTNIENRIVALPIKVSNYKDIHIIGDKVYYLEKPMEGSQALKVFNLKEEEEKTCESGINGYSLSPDNKKMVLAKGGKLYVVDPPSGAIALEDPVSTSDLKTFTQPQAEWEQIFDESWRQMRDFFYDEDMHGVDWAQMKDRYKALLPYVAHRNDLTYIIGEMIGELNVGHAYVQSGERVDPEKIETGLLGAEIIKDQSGYFKITRILEGANWDRSLRSPLTELGTEVKEGDYIVSVDGQDLKQSKDLYKHLVGKAGKTVELGISATADSKKAKQVLVVPIADESELYYYNWVKSNIEKVDKATNGQVGYLHVPDMGRKGLNEFTKLFYPQVDKKALIIDNRGNGGGNVSPMIVERLRREVIRQRATRNVEKGIPVPMAVQRGPKVLLVDEYSASDGDLFTYAFQKFNLGPVIGKRTWGGVVGITSSLPFIDGGSLNRPEFASYSSEEKQWIIEGYGVDPDIEVGNNPYKEYIGEDQQLEKAIAVTLELLKDYVPLPGVPDGPDRSRKTHQE